MIKKSRNKKVENKIIKIKMNIKRIYLFIFLSFLLVVVGILVVNAYNSNPANDPSRPPIFGHSSDEVDINVGTDVGGAILKRNLQKMMNEIPGKYLCTMKAEELAGDGCPAGSYLYRVFRVGGAGSPGDAYCKFYFSRNDNSNSIPNCYVAGNFNEDLDPCGGWVDEPFPHRIYCN